MTVSVPQSSDDSRQVVRGIDSDGNLTYSQVDISEVSFKGRFGAVDGSFSEHSATIGIKTFLLIEGRDFRVGDDVQITSLNDLDVFMWGEVIGSTTTSQGGLELTVFVDDVSEIGADATYNLWELQVVARPKPGIEKDTSTSSNNPTTGGPWTFTVTSGKFFPIGGTLLIKPTENRTIAVIGEVKAYSGTSLVVSLRETNATVSESYDSWSIALLDAPPAKLPQKLAVGLNITANAANNWVTISPGDVMDSTGNILLSLSSNFSKAFAGAWTAGHTANGCMITQGAGTATFSGTTVTGTGSNFDDLFVRGDGDVDGAGIAGQGLTDYKISGGLREVPSVVSVAANWTSAIGVGAISATSMSTVNTMFGTNVAYYRGSHVGRDSGNNTFWLFIVLIRKDSDGSLDVCFSPATPDGEPDLPAGYTYYRVIGVAEIGLNQGALGSNRYRVEQHLYHNAPYAPSTATYITLQNDDLEQALNSSSLAVDPSNLSGGTLGVDVSTEEDPPYVSFILSNMAAYTLKGRNSGTTGRPSDISIPALTTKATPASGDYVLITDGAASNAFKKVDVSTLGGGGTSFPTDMGLITEAATTTFDLGTIV